MLRMLQRAEALDKASSCRARIVKHHDHCEEVKRHLLRVPFGPSRYSQDSP